MIYQIDLGSEGEINAVKWKKNNKIYALKKCKIHHIYYLLLCFIF